ncbi:glycosyltransferase family 2 protein [Vibrio alfacsensis]|uniref:glycosyltransferase family 2 protein n=1 Tax=Vibrio alfacsensis TaxID=1074311 RepID=UPI0040690EC5
MNAQPLISVVIATCNRPKLALRAVRSVLTQTYSNVEVIVVNNGSTANAIKEYDKLFVDLNIRYINVNNPYSIGLGPAKARNLGISVAKGDYIAFCDDDDEWIDNNYLQYVADAISHSGADVIFADQESVLINGESDKKQWYSPELISRFSGKVTLSLFSVDIQYFYQYGGFPHLNTIVYSTQHIAKYGAFRDTIIYEEDFELFIRLASKAKEISYIDKVVSRHYVPDKNQKTNASSKLSDVEKQLTRLAIFNVLSIFSEDKKLQVFLNKHSCYASTKLALKMLKQGDNRRAKKFLRQALGANFKAKLFVLYLIIIAKQVFRSKK